MRTSDKNMNKILKRQVEKTFVQVLADLKAPDEVESALKDFFTETELETFAKRLAIAYWLRKGRSYANIKENLKVSSATIAVVSEMMKAPGFELLLKRVEADEWANLWSDRIKKFVKSS